jgi:hypothetical protein
MRLAGEKEAVKEQEANDRMLSELAWRDVQEYQAAEREKSRQSLAFRLADSRRQQAAALEEHRKALDIMHEELETKHRDWQDVNAYKEKEKSNRRKSVALRLESWRSQKMAEEKLKAKKMLIMEEDARYKEQDWEDLMKAKRSLKEEEIANLKLGRMVF